MLVRPMAIQICNVLLSVNISQACVCAVCVCVRACVCVCVCVTKHPLSRSVCNIVPCIVASRPANLNILKSVQSDLPVVATC